ncbi:MAG: hypothetical protein LQ349_009777, partial [Xanthoria aureola]
LAQAQQSAAQAAADVKDDNLASLQQPLRPMALLRRHEGRRPHRAQAGADFPNAHMADL